MFSLSILPINSLYWSTWATCRGGVQGGGRGGGRCVSQVDYTPGGLVQCQIYIRPCNWYTPLLCPLQNTFNHVNTQCRISWQNAPSAWISDQYWDQILPNRWEGSIICWTHSFITGSTQPRFSQFYPFTKSLKLGAM